MNEKLERLITIQNEVENHLFYILSQLEPPKNENAQIDEESKLGDDVSDFDRSNLGREDLDQS